MAYKALNLTGQASWPSLPVCVCVLVAATVQKPCAGSRLAFKCFPRGKLQIPCKTDKLSLGLSCDAVVLRILFLRDGFQGRCLSLYLSTYIFLYLPLSCFSSSFISPSLSVFPRRKKLPLRKLFPKDSSSRTTFLQHTPSFSFPVIKDDLFFPDAKSFRGLDLPAIQPRSSGNTTSRPNPLNPDPVSTEIFAQFPRQPACLTLTCSTKIVFNKTNQYPNRNQLPHARVSSGGPSSADGTL